MSSGKSKHSHSHGSHKVQAQDGTDPFVWKDNHTSARDEQGKDSKKKSSSHRQSQHNHSHKKRLSASQAHSELKRQASGHILGKLDDKKSQQGAGFSNFLSILTDPPLQASNPSAKKRSRKDENEEIVDASQQEQEDDIDAVEPLKLQCGNRHHRSDPSCSEPSYQESCSVEPLQPNGSCNNSSSPSSRNFSCNNCDDDRVGDCGGSCVSDPCNTGPPGPPGQKGCPGNRGPPGPQGDPAPVVQVLVFQSGSFTLPQNAATWTYYLSPSAPAVIQGSSPGIPWQQQSASFAFIQTGYIRQFLLNVASMTTGTASTMNFSISAVLQVTPNTFGQLLQPSYTTVQTFGPVNLALTSSNTAIYAIPVLFGPFAPIEIAQGDNAVLTITITDTLGTYQVQTSAINLDISATMWINYEGNP